MTRAFAAGTRRFHPVTIEPSNREPAAVFPAVPRDDPARLPSVRPARVAGILHCTDARPRTVATLSAPSFMAAKKLSLQISPREVRH